MLRRDNFLIDPMWRVVDTNIIYDKALFVEVAKGLGTRALLLKSMMQPNNQVGCSCMSVQP